MKSRKTRANFQKTNEKFKKRMKFSKNDRKIQKTMKNEKNAQKSNFQKSIIYH